MFRLLRWAIFLSILLVVLIVAALFSIDPMAKNLIETHIRSRTGMDVKIGRVSVGLFSPTLTLQQVKLYNTAEFGGSPFLDLPELYLEYDRTALRAHRLHLRLVRAEVAEFHVVENREGKNNLQRLSPPATSSQAQGGRPPMVSVPNRSGPAPRPGPAQVAIPHSLPGPTPSTSTSASTPTPPPGPGPILTTPAPAPAPTAASANDLVFAGIDTLNLTLYKGSFTSLRRPAVNREVVFAIRNEVYHNINTRQNLESVLIAVALKGGANFLLESMVRGNAPAPLSAPAAPRRPVVPPAR